MISKFFVFIRDSMSNAHNKILLHTKKFHENLHFKTEDYNCPSKKDRLNRNNPRDGLNFIKEKFLMTPRAIKSEDICSTVGSYRLLP